MQLSFLCIKAILYRRFPTMPLTIWEIIGHFEEILQKSMESLLKESNRGSPQSDPVASQF